MVLCAIKTVTLNKVRYENDHCLYWTMAYQCALDKLTPRKQTIT